MSKSNSLRNLKNKKCPTFQKQAIDRQNEVRKYFFCFFVIASTKGLQPTPPTTPTPTPTPTRLSCQVVGPKLIARKIFVCFFLLFGHSIKKLCRQLKYWFYKYFTLPVVQISSRTCEPNSEFVSRIVLKVI